VIAIRRGRDAPLAAEEDGRILSVSDRTARDWLSRMDKDAKEATDRRIFDMWMACATQQEIAEAEDMPRETVRNETGNFGQICNLAKSAKAAAEHAVDFDPPIYNIWKQQEKTSGSKPFRQTLRFAHLQRGGQL
jgi:hypothetical protein